MTFHLFEVSWEVCNKVGGIHTVVSTKASTLVRRLADEYVCVGPWLLNNPESDRAFEESPGFEAFTESCRELGVPCIPVLDPVIHTLAAYFGVTIRGRRERSAALPMLW